MKQHFSETQGTKKTEEKTDERKHYVKPEIVHELELETRAGSPLPSVPNPLSGKLRR